MTLILNGTSDSASLPAVTSADTDTGLYYPAANQVALATNGTLALIVDSSQFVGIGTATPSDKLHVYGTSATAGNINLRVTNTAADAYAELRVQNSGASGRLYSIGTAGNTATAPYATNLYVYDNTSGLPCTITNRFGMGLGSTAPSSGLGIAFPATQSASSDANTLDDYEEGGWTPTYSQGVTSPVYTGTGGFYKKVGNLVYVSGRIQLTSGTGNASALVLSGLPFTSLNGTGSQSALCIGFDGGFKSDGNITLLVTGGASYAEFYKWDGSAFLGTNSTSITATLHFSGCYHAA